VLIKMLDLILDLVVVLICVADTLLSLLSMSPLHISHDMPRPARYSSPLTTSVMSCTPFPILTSPHLTRAVLSSYPHSSLPPYYLPPLSLHLRRTVIGEDPRTAQHTQALTLSRNALTDQSR
jgi:hypothetical protein